MLIIIFIICELKLLMVPLPTTLCWAVSRCSWGFVWQQYFPLTFHRQTLWHLRLGFGLSTCGHLLCAPPPPPPALSHPASLLANVRQTVAAAGWELIDSWIRVQDHPMVVISQLPVSQLCVRGNCSTLRTVNKRGGKNSLLIGLNIKSGDSSAARNESNNAISGGVCVYSVCVHYTGQHWRWI